MKLRKKKGHIDVLMVDDVQARELWPKHKEITLDECLKDTDDRLKHNKVLIIPLIGAWLKEILTQRATGLGEQYEDGLLQNDYDKWIGLNANIAEKFAQIYNITAFKYSLKFLEEELVYLKTGNNYWVLEKKRYEALKSKFDGSSLNMYL